MSSDEKDSWSSYRPSKSVWFWSLIGASVLTTAVGFTWGGWTTTGRALVMQDIAVRNAKAELVAGICVHNFVNSRDAENNLRVLKAKSYWDRDDFIKAGGWMKIAGVSSAVTDAAEECASQLVKLKAIPPPDNPTVAGSWSFDRRR